VAIYIEKLENRRSGPLSGQLGGLTLVLTSLCCSLNSTTQAQKTNYSPQVLASPTIFGNSNAPTFLNAFVDSALLLEKAPEVLCVDTVNIRPRQRPSVFVLHLLFDVISAYTRHKEAIFTALAINTVLPF
jgi:hypothetical protein